MGPFLDAQGQHPVDTIIEVASIPVAGLRDLLATKLKVIGDRGELRDNFDVLVIERDTGHRVEKGLAVIVERYRPATPDAIILHIVRALGDLDDVADDPALPMDRTKIEPYWKKRQPKPSAPSTGSPAAGHNTPNHPFPTSPGDGKR